MSRFPNWRESPRDALPQFAITARGVAKRYRGVDGSPPVQALSDVDLAVPRGEIFGLLGPNGAGKSTFINILAGLVRKSAGGVEIWGHDIDADPRLARASIGIVPQELNMDPFFTARELLDVQAGYYGVPRARRRTQELLSIMGLTSKANTRGRDLSGGQKRRLMMAKAMVHSPPVLVLDEPTAGVDIELRQQIYRYIRHLQSEGTTIVLTTHYLEEAENLCKRIAIINEGRVVACDTTDALLDRLDHKELVLTLSEDMHRLPAELESLGATLPAPRRIVFHYGDKEHKVSDILDAVHRAGIDVADLSTDETDLEDIFLLLTKQPEDAAGQPAGQNAYGSVTA